MSVSTSGIDQLAINTIRTLSMDAVEAAASGHPGTPMALAPVAYTLFNRVMSYDPAAPDWPARDRFVLSCGHASMLLYSTLHLCGVKALDKSGKRTDKPAITLDNIRNFRQLHSPCAGHPEHGEAAGIETTTGPLGQGIGNSVGMAIAQGWLAARYNKPGFPLFDYNVYALCSDGDMMEGVGAEAASLAGHLKLSNLCWIYDDNKITIEGGTPLAFSEDVAMRFRGLGWHTLHVDDANDLKALESALGEFHATTDKPTFIVVKSHIGYGSPNKQDSSAAHGSKLGADEVRLTKQVYGWPEDAQFLVPDGVMEHFAAGIGKRGAAKRTEWESLRSDYAKKHANLSAELDAIASGDLPQGWDADIQDFPADAKGTASRNSSGKVLNQVAKRVPWLVGGSADLAPSTKTLVDGEDSLAGDNHGGRNLHFGIREHAMGAILNGMALTGLRPYGSTFLVFSDYCRPSMRLASIMGLPSLFIFTHDSIGVGEDGPTHQPVEHVSALRAIPRMIVMRPGDANEVAQCWRTIMPLGDHPVSLILTRQNLPTLDRTKYASAAGASQGAYILADSKGTPQVILMASGSEVSLAVEAHEELTAAGIASRVVSMPSWELFEMQDAAYRDKVLPPGVTARVAVEAGVEHGWDRYLGPGGRFIGMKSFGASAPAEELYEHFGITAAAMTAAAKDLVG